MTIFLVILGLFLLILGAMGTVFPALPGLPLMMLGAWSLASAHDYTIIQPFSLGFMLFIGAFGIAMDYVAGLLGAKFSGASKTALWGSFIGSVVGLFLGIVGIFLGPLLGAAIGEFIHRRDLLVAGKVGIGAFIGFIVGTVAKIGCAIAILLCLLFSYLSDWII